MPIPDGVKSRRTFVEIIILVILIGLPIYENFRDDAMLTTVNKALLKAETVHKKDSLENFRLFAENHVLGDSLNKVVLELHMPKIRSFAVGKEHADTLYDKWGKGTDILQVVNGYQIVVQPTDTSADYELVSEDTTYFCHNKDCPGLKTLPKFLHFNVGGANKKPVFVYYYVPAAANGKKKP